MPHADRRSFFADLFNLNPEKIRLRKSTYNISQDEAFKKYANKSLPLNVKKTRSTLAPYNGVFGEKQKIHLLRRAMFGVKKSDLANINSMTMDQAIDTLINTTNSAVQPPINYYEAEFADTQGIALGQTWINTAFENGGGLNGYRINSVRTNWLHNMITQPISIEEKMILFWHNHFATQFPIVYDCKVFYQYHSMLRQNALGNFKDFVKAVTKNTMMLYYLNGLYNNKYSPDENYARELQELFTLGTGPNMWNEDDVKAVAKVLTGFRADIYNTATNTTSNAYINYFYDPTWHDENDKTFSNFYSNTIITGQVGAAGENELDNLIDMIFAKDEIVSKFIVRKIYRYFIHYDIDSDVETNIITPLAQTFASSNWDIKPLLTQLFKSNHFFDTLNMDCLLKNPYDQYIGMMRACEIPLPATTDYANYHNTLIFMNYYLSDAGMDLGNPPNVAGWPAYHQVPQFHQIWINSDSIAKRMQFADYLFTDWGVYSGATDNIKSNVFALAQQCPTPENPVDLIDYFVVRFLTFTLSQARKNELKSILLSGQATDYYWTQAWVDYLANPTDPTLEGTVKFRLQQFFTQLFRKAENQIC
jgi:uncharacterized protein (DUF1800 family)